MNIVQTSPTVFHMSCSSNLDGFSDGKLVTIKLQFCGMLLPGLVK